MGGVEGQGDPYQEGTRDTVDPQKLDECGQKPCVEVGRHDSNLTFEIILWNHCNLEVLFVLVDIAYMLWLYNPYILQQLHYLDDLAHLVVLLCPCFYRTHRRCYVPSLL